MANRCWKCGSIVKLEFGIWRDKAGDSLCSSGVHEVENPQPKQDGE